MRDDLDTFEFVEGEFEVDGARLTDRGYFLEMHQVAWDLVSRVATQFGLERPQLIPEPGTLGDDLQY